MLSKRLRDRFDLFESGIYPCDKKSLSVTRKVLVLISGHFNAEPDVGLLDDGCVEITCKSMFMKDALCCVLDMTVPNILIYMGSSSTKTHDLIEKDDNEEDKQAAEIFNYIKSYSFCCEIK
jgi:hypothetical protein